MNVNNTVIVLAFVATAGLAGCSSTNNKVLAIKQGGADVIDVSTAADNKKNINGMSDNITNVEQSSKQNFDAQSQQLKENQVTANNSTLVGQTIYFLYDSSDVEPEFIPLIEKQSQNLLGNPAGILTLEGHADERGSREYNIALGEERAKTIAKMMLARGVRVKQLEIVSYGEEKPATTEHTETAWHLNRRVNLISQRTQK